MFVTCTNVVVYGCFSKNAFFRLKLKNTPQTRVFCAKCSIFAPLSKNPFYSLLIYMEDSSASDMKWKAAYFTLGCKLNFAETSTVGQQLKAAGIRDKVKILIGGAPVTQEFCDKIGAEVKVADGADGWFNAESAKKHLDQAVKDLGKFVTWPIQLDVVYYSASDSQVSQATAYKQLLEETLGSDRVVVNLVEATTSHAGYYI